MEGVMRTKALGGMIVGVMLAATLAAWSWLPDRIPSHWNIAGDVDGWIGRFPGAFLMPGLALATWLLVPLLRRLDPRRENYERFEGTFWLVVNGMVVFFAALHGLMLLAALGVAVDVTRWLLALLGVLLIVLGNVMPRIRSNWWMGVRTPWTLESERVWRDTHRLAGRTFMAAGVLALLAVPLPSEVGFWVMMAAVMLAALVPVAYSFILWRRERREAQP
jgi:uncharacterized membrane protein